MRNRFLFMHVLLGLSLLIPKGGSTSAWAQSSPSKGNLDPSNPDVAAILQIATDFSEAYKAGDVKRVVEFYSPDVVYMY